MSSIAKSELDAVLGYKVVIFLDRAGKDIHHEDFVTNSGKHVETTRMEGHSSGVFSNRGVVGHLELSIGPVPDDDVLF